MIHEVDNNGMPQSPQRKAFLECLIHFMLPIASDVMVNQFGNYLCQRIMEVADPSGLESLVNQISYDLVPISLNIHGTRVIQILIERLSLGILDGIHSNIRVIERAKDKKAPFEQMEGFKFSPLHTLYDKLLRKVISCLNTQVVDLTIDMHGNHVIQSLLMVFKAAERPQDADNLGGHQISEYTEFIFKACIDNCVPIGKHKHGCCVMQRCLEKGSRAQKLELANYIIDNIH